MGSLAAGAATGTTTLGRLLDDVAADRRGHLALVIGERRLGYAQLRDEADALAAGLLAIGIGKGDHVVLWLPNFAEAYITLFAVAKTGAVFSPVNPRLKPRELAFVLESSDAKALIFMPSLGKFDYEATLREILPELGREKRFAGFPHLRHVITLGGRIPGAARYEDLLASGLKARAAAAAVGPADPALLLYTSGSTSFPKAARVAHGPATRMAHWLGEHFGFTREDRYFVCNPICHAGGTLFSYLPAISHGSTFHTLPVWRADDALRVMKDERCTVQHGIDTHYWMEAEDPSFDPRALSLRLCSVAGLVNSLPRAHELFRPTVTFSMYGATEQGGGPVCGHHADRAEKQRSSHGQALPGVDLAIVDPDTGKELPRGARGEIRIGGWSVMMDYYRQPELTAQTFDEDRRLRSGDVGFVDDDGYLTFLGRIKNVLRVGGENVSPEEIEEVLRSHGDISQAVVVGFADDRLGEVPVAYVVPRPGVTLPDDEVLAHCRRQLASFKMPKFIEFVASEDLPLTESGKIHRPTLQTRFAEKQGAADRVKETSA